MVSNCRDFAQRESQRQLRCKMFLSDLLAERLFSKIEHSFDEDQFGAFDCCVIGIVCTINWANRLKYEFVFAMHQKFPSFPLAYVITSGSLLM